MIRYSSNTFRHRIALLCDGPKVRPEPRSNRGNQPRFAILCAENIMDPKRAKSVGHRGTYGTTEITISKYVFIINTPSPRPSGMGSFFILEYWR